jgi:integrase
LPAFRGTAKEAEAHKRALIRDHADVPVGYAPKALTVAQACLDDIATRLANNHIGRTTAQWQRDLVAHYIASTPLSRIQLDALTTTHVEAFMRELAGRDARNKTTKLAPSTRAAVYRLLSQTCQQAVVARAIRWNPVSGTKPPRQRTGAPRAVEFDALERILAAAQGATRDVLELAMRTGMRRGEICGLSWGDIDLTADPPVLQIRRNVTVIAGVRVIGEPKTPAAKRTIPLSDDLVALFRPLLVTARENVLKLGVRLPDLPVFPEVDGGWMFPRSLTLRVKRVMHKVGLPDARLHDMRHSFVTHAFKATGDWHLVSARAGHRNVKTTIGLYGHLLADDAKKVVDPMALAIPVRRAVSK